MPELSLEQRKTLNEVLGALEKRLSSVVKLHGRASMVPGAAMSYGTAITEWLKALKTGDVTSANFSVRLAELRAARRLHPAKLLAGVQDWAGAGATLGVMPDPLAALGEGVLGAVDAPVGPQLPTSSDVPMGKRPPPVIAAAQGKPMPTVEVPGLAEEAAVASAEGRSKWGQLPRKGPEEKELGGLFEKRWKAALRGESVVGKAVPGGPRPAALLAAMRRGAPSGAMPGMGGLTKEAAKALGGSRAKWVKGLPVVRKGGQPAVMAALLAAAQGEGLGKAGEVAEAAGRTAERVTGAAGEPTGMLKGLLDKMGWKKPASKSVAALEAAGEKSLPFLKRKLPIMKVLGPAFGIWLLWDILGLGGEAKRALGLPSEGGGIAGGIREGWGQSEEMLRQAGAMRVPSAVELMQRFRTQEGLQERMSGGGMPAHRLARLKANDPTAYDAVRWAMMGRQAPDITGSEVTLGGARPSDMPDDAVTRLLGNL